MRCITVSAARLFLWWQVRQRHSSARLELAQSARVRSSGWLGMMKRTLGEHQQGGKMRRVYQSDPLELAARTRRKCWAGRP